MSDVQTIQKRLKGLLLKRPGFAVALTGPAGIGKTFTVQSLLREIPCRHLSIHATTSLSNLVKALPKPKKPQAWTERILERIEANEFVENKVILEFLGAMLLGLSPFIVHLEDIHELSGDQLEFVQELANVTKRLKGVALIVTSRTTPDEVFEAVPLEGLSGSEVQAILEREAGAVLPTDVLKWIQARAAGNPLFTLEFFRFLARQGALWNDGQGWHWREPASKAMPVTVEALIEYELNKVMASQSPLGAWITDGLSARALLPEPDLNLWQEVTGCDANTFQQVRIELERCSILREDQFVHPLFAEVALHLISAQDKQRLAARAFRALKSQHPQQASQFMDLAGAQNTEKLEVLQRAAESCADQKQKGHFLHQAVRLAEGTLKAELAWRAAQILQHHDLERALEMCREALQLSDRAAVVETMALLFARKNDMAGLTALLESTQSELSVAEIRIRGLVTLGRYADVIGIWEADPVLQTTTAPEVLYAAAVSYLATRQLPKFQAILQQGLQASNDGSQPENRMRFLNLKAIYDSDRGEPSAAIEQYLLVLEYMRKSGSLFSLGATLHNLGGAYKAVQQYELARNALQESFEIRRTAGDARQYAYSLSVMAEIQADLGLQAEAENTIQEALNIFALQPGSHFHIVGLSQASIVYSQSNAPMAALLQQKFAAQALKFAQEGQNKNLLMEILYDHLMALIRNRDQDQAKLALEEFESLSAVIENAPYRWRLKKAQAHLQELLGALEHAKSLFAEAIPLANAVHDQLNAQKLGLELDRLNNNPAGAQQRLEWFEGKGFLAAAAVTRGYFPQLLADGSKDQTSHSPTRRLEVLGSMQVASDTSEPIRGRKRQELLALLLETRMAGRNEIGRLQLLDALYPDDDEDQANSSLKQAIRTVRASFGAEVIQTTSNGYALGEIGSDAEAFLQTGDTRLWRGQYLAGDLESHDDGIRENLHLALLKNAQRILESDPEEALRVGKILMAFDAYNLEHLEVCVRALQLRNNHKSLNRLYSEARAGLLEVAEVIPERWQDFLKSRSGSLVN
jgi:hypothetical protein